MAHKILHIMPAQGWAAKYSSEEDAYLTPLLGWALVQEAEATRVVGLVAGKDVELCDEDPAFAGYAFAPDMLVETLDGLDEDEDDEDFGDDEPPPPTLRRPTRLN